MKTSITMAVSSALIGLSSAQCKYGQVVSEDDINTIVPLDVCIAKLDGSNKAHVYSCHEDGTLLKQSFTTYNCDAETYDGYAALSDELINVECDEQPLCDYYHVYEFPGAVDAACGPLEIADLNEDGQGGISSRFFMSGISGGELNVCEENSAQTGFEQGAVTSDYCDAEIAVTGPAIIVNIYSDDQCSIAAEGIADAGVVELTNENLYPLSFDDNKCRYFVECSSALTVNTASDVGEYDEYDAGSYAGSYSADDDEYYAEGGDSGSYAEDYAESDVDVTIDGHSTDGDNYGGDDDGSDDGYDTGNCAWSIIMVVIIIAILYYCLK